MTKRREKKRHESKTLNCREGVRYIKKERTLSLSLSLTFRRGQRETPPPPPLERDDDDFEDEDDDDHRDEGGARRPRDDRSRRDEKTDDDFDVDDDDGDADADADATTTTVSRGQDDFECDENETYRREGVLFTQRCGEPRGGVWIGGEERWKRWHDVFVRRRDDARSKTVTNWPDCKNFSRYGDTRRRCYLFTRRGRGRKIFVCSSVYSLRVERRVEFIRHVADVFDSKHVRERKRR